MQSTQLSVVERLLLRSRMIFGFSLANVCLGFGVVGAIQFIDDPGHQYLWFCLVLFGVAGAFAFGRIGWRFFKDLRAGTKTLSQHKLKNSFEKNGRYYFSVQGKKLQVSQEVYEQAGNQVVFHQSRSGYTLLIEKGKLD